MISVALRSPHTKGIFLLVLTTLIWATSFPLLKHTLNSLPSSVILAVRFSIAAAAIAPWLRQLNRSLMRDGILLGCIYFTECASALKGLETISASRSAVLISLNVILVPLLGGLLGQRFQGKVLLSAFVALVGIGIMSWEGGGLSQGDLLTIVCAVGVAVYILLLEAIAPRHSTLPLVAVQLTTMAVLGLVFAIPELIGSVEAIATQSTSLLYLGLVVTATPIWTQALAQRWVAAHEAALLYTLEPVFATLFAIWFLGEGFSLRGFIGAGFILAATAFSQQPSQK